MTEKEPNPATVSAWEVAAIKKALRAHKFEEFEGFLKVKELSLSEFCRCGDDWPQYAPTLNELVAYLGWATKTEHNITQHNFSMEIVGRLLKAVRKQETE